MTLDMKTIIYPVKDLSKAKALFSSLLGVEPAQDRPYYVGYRIGDLDIGLDPNGHSRGITGPVAYWNVDDIQTILKKLLDAGGEQLQEPTDVGGGMLIATVKDADGN